MFNVDDFSNNGCPDISEEEFVEKFGSCPAPILEMDDLLIYESIKQDGFCYGFDDDEDVILPSRERIRNLIVALIDILPECE